MTAALIKPIFEFLNEWAERKGLSTSSPEDLVSNPDVIARYQVDIDTVNEQYATWGKMKQFRLTPDVWSVDGGHLTPTMKLRRKIVKQKYKQLYEEIYGHPPA